MKEGEVKSRDLMTIMLCKPSSVYNANQVAEEADILEYRIVEYVLSSMSFIM